MRSGRKLNLISVEDYLDGELVAPWKHEYVAGVVYAMAGARNVHNIIAGNIFAALHSRLRGRPCQPFNSDTKIRVLMPTHVRFYYPDASVVCRPNPQGDSFQDTPVVIFEVVSHATRRTDEGEKRDAYLTIPSLSVYAVVEQETDAMVVQRRTEHGFVREVYQGLAAVLPLPEIAAELPLAEVYERVEFTPEPVDDEP
jgi:Uma2 family endonuclease